MLFKENYFLNLCHSFFALAMNHYKITFVNVLCFMLLLESSYVVYKFSKVYIKLGSTIALQVGPF